MLLRAPPLPLRCIHHCLQGTYTKICVNKNTRKRRVVLVPGSSFEKKKLTCKCTADCILCCKGSCKKTTLNFNGRSEIIYLTARNVLTL